jgi:hypothetical protein
MSKDRTVSAAFALPGSVAALQRLGGTGLDRAGAMVVGPDGDIYVTGTFAGSMTIGDKSLVGTGSRDAFAARMTPTGTVVWARSFGGTGSASGMGIDADSSGNVWIGVLFSGGLSVGGDPVAGTGLYLAKLASRDGGHVLSRVVPITSAWLNLDAMHVDGAGDIIVAGTFQRQINMGGADLISYAGSEDIVLAKYDSAGAHLWSKRIGLQGVDRSHGLVIDSDGNLVVVGEIAASVDFGGGPRAASGAGDMFLAKYSPTGQHIWSVVKGSTSHEVAQSVVADRQGTLLVTGGFAGTVSICGPTLTSKGEEDIFVAKFSLANGTCVWARAFGEAERDEGLAIAADENGNAFVTGSVIGAVDFGTGSLTGSGDQDVFAIKLAASTGAVQFGTLFGGPANDFGAGVSVLPNGNPLLFGVFAGTAIFGDRAATSAGDLDLFLLELNR